MLLFVSSHAGDGPRLAFRLPPPAGSGTSGTAAPAAPSGGAARRTPTETLMPRLSDGKPRQVPEIGTTWYGSRATATRIRPRLPTMPLVGSNSTQPEPGRKIRTQACVFPPPT